MHCPPPITDKREMYRQLAAGTLGNTIPQFFSVADWQASREYHRFDLWGVRSSRHAAHPMTRMYVPRVEVEAYAATHFADGVNISNMVDTFLTVTAWLEVYESDAGLVVQGIEYPDRGLSWRHGMRDPARLRTWERTAARMVLRKHLNADSLADLESLLSLYPGHVVELSACEQRFGTVPGRNAIVWEVRNY